jgi:hypothetical protein
LPYAIRQALAWIALIGDGSPARAGRTTVVALVPLDAMPSILSPAPSAVVLTP